MSLADDKMRGLPWVHQLPADCEESVIQSAHLVQGLCRMTAAQFKDAESCVRLWIHECERVFADRLISEADIAKFTDLRVNTTKKFFANFKQVGLIVYVPKVC